MEEQGPKFINPVPLIPPLEKPTCPDTSHIIREEFQKIIGEDEFPITIAQNLANNQLENIYLLQCGLEVLKSKEELENSERNITNAELSIMQSQATYLVQSTYKEVNRNVIENIYPSINPEIIEKYSLLEIDNILPNMYQRILNNKLSPINFIFEDSCFMPEGDNGLAICCGPPNLNLTDQQKWQLKILARSTKYSNLRKTNFPGLGNKYANQMVFKVYPKRIVFRNFRHFKIYEKKLVLKNITNHLQHIIIPRIPKTSLFYINAINTDTRVAPGMSFTFTVGFRADTVENCCEHIIIKVIGSQPIKIDVNSYMDMPFLKGLVYHKDFMEGSIRADQVKNTVYNYSIDCGTVLYGCHSECNFILQNTGGLSRFFLIPEQDWYDRHIKCITDNFKLNLKDFKIYPAFFVLRKNEICELKLEFCPTEEGLILDKLFLVSDNNNVEEIDIFGDCIYFEPDFFVFELPECPSAPFKKKGEIKNVLHMGAIYYSQTIFANFYMYNRSLISIPYECRVEEVTENENYYITNKEWIKIKPECGTILPLTGENLEVSVKMESKNIGLYKFNISVFAIDIPEISLQEGPIFTFGEEYRSKDLKQKLLTILVDKVEVQIHHIKLPVRLYPDVIVLPKLLYKTITIMRHIKIVNDGFCCLKFHWIQKQRCNKKVKIKVKPNEFQINAMESAICSVFIKSKSYDDINETITLVINNGFSEKHLPIIGKVEKPKMRVTKSFINFGHIRIHSKIENVFTVTNLSEACLCWEVKEFQYNYYTHEFIEAEYSNLSETSGQLCQINNETDILYTLDTSAPKKFFSLLIFFTIYKYEKYESTHVFLLGYIHEPKVRIETICNGIDTFRIEDIYYVNESITKTFELHNDSLVEANYNWGAASGYHTNHLKFAFDFNKGVLYPNSRKFINITLILKKSGIIFDFYIPCYVQHMPEPLILQILCVIKNPQIVFYIPTMTDYTEVIWPIDFEPVSHVSDEAASYDIKDISQESDSKSINLGDSISTIVSGKNKLQSSKGTEWNLDNIFKYLHNMEMDGEEDVLDSIKSKTISESISSNTVQSECGLYSKFASETSICENVIYFFNVKCKEVYTKTFKIKNPMSYSLKYVLSIEHFKTKEFKRKRLEDLYIDLKWKKDDSLSKQLSDYGILVTVEPISDVMQHNSEVTLTITVYAETWGYYLEELSIDIEQIPTFYMNLVIQVVGNPIEIPMLTKSDGYIQFTNIQKCTFEQNRRLTLYNSSNIPCIIIWHVFLKSKKYINDSEPFNVIYDICGFENEPQIIGNVKIMKHVGKELNNEFQLFWVEPKELYLEPKQARQITIFFKPSLYEESGLDSLNIRACIVGSIYIEEKNKHSNFVLRNPIKELQLLNIPVKTTISYSSLDLKCIRGDKNIVMNVNDILNGVLTSKNLRLVFRNNCKSDIVLTMTVTEPFEIISLRTRIASNDTYTSKLRIPVLSNGYLEAIIKCVITNENLLNIADVLYKKADYNLKETEIISENCIKISRFLKMKFYCNEIQTLPISVTLYYPLIQVSSRTLDFGTVCLNSRKHMTFKITNKTASKTWVNITILNKKKLFKVDQSEAYLEPCKACPKSLYLTVTFTPSTNKRMTDTMRIKTKLPQYYIDVTITGIGTYDEKYYYENSLNDKCFQLKK